MKKDIQTMRLTKPSKPYLDPLTTYDVLKTIAVILMVVDHIGYYFYKDIEWFRVFGRMSVPIWFFLVGYARSRDISAHLWVGMVVLIIANIIFGLYLLPLNILATIMCVRLVIDKIGNLAFRGIEPMVYSLVVLAVMIIPTWALVEYGTISIILALAGYGLRNRESIAMPESTFRFVFGFLILFYAFSQIVIFNFAPLSSQVMFVGVGLVGLMLYHFQPKPIEDFTYQLPAPVISVMKICGRYSLEIYVLHLLLFKMIGMALGLEGYGWLDFDVFVQG